MTDKSKKQPSSFSWILIHVIFPMLPFLIEGIIRFIILDFSMNLYTFSSTTLSASIGLLCLFINQNLLAHNIPLPDEYEQSKIYGTATLFLTYAMISFILFAIIILLEAIGEKHNLLKDARYIFEWIVFIFFLLPIVTAIKTQRSYKLRAVI
ncbi:membrane protein [Beggiatoa sp. PS]|nr:membrane protein [Beggiatoa sp. PS]